MTNELTPYPEPRDITQYVEPPQMYPPYSVRYQESGRGLDLHSIWGFVRRNWWILALGLALGAGAATVYNRVARPIYAASATIQVEGEDASTDPTGFSMMPTVSDIATDIMVLRSRSLAERVADSLQLQVGISKPEGLERNDVFSEIRVARDARSGKYVLQRTAQGAYDLTRLEGPRLASVRLGEPVSINGLTFVLAPEATRHERIDFAVRSYQAAVSRITSHLLVTSPGKDPNSGILQINYRDSDPDLAARVLNTLTAQFIAHRRREQKQAATSTVDFLRVQLDTLAVDLREAEMRLREYRESAQVIDLASEGANKISQLASLQAQLDQIAVERNSLARLRAGLGEPDALDPLAPSPYRRLVGYPGLMGNASLSMMLGSLTALETERAELLERRRLEDPNVVALTGQIKDIEEQMQGHIDTYLEGLDSKLTSLSAVVGRSGGEMMEIPRKEFELAQVQRQSDLLRETFVLLQTRLKEAEITQAIEDPNVSVLDPALKPRRPVKPRPLWNLMLGVVIGLAVGVGVAYTREYLDTRIHTRDDLRDLAGLPVLGLIPRISMLVGALPVSPRRLLKAGGGNGTESDGNEPTPRLVVEHDRNSAVSEAYRSLRTNITFSSTAERISKVFVLTSPTPQDGKTTTAANLSVTFAQQGLRTLLVDGDMRRGIVHKLFSVPRTPGLSNILVEDVDLDHAIHVVQLDQGTQLGVLPKGTVPPNPAELISSPRMKWLIERLEERYDAIVFDTPPLTLVTDAAILATHAHTVLLVARANKTEQGAISFAMEQLRNVGAPVRGAILNDVDFKRDRRYGTYGGKYDYHAYSYGYSSEE